MEKIGQLYKCESCGNIIEIIHSGKETPNCCGKSMIPLKENSTDAAVEKHVPVIERTGTGYKITVGSVLHPMQDNHYIEFIELIADGISYKKFLNPGDQPIAEFQMTAKKITAREYCNLHGLWRADL